MNFDHPQLTRQQEIDLAETGTDENRVRIAESQLPAIYAECRRMAGQSADEVFSDAWLAAMNAARKWKPNGESRFWGYAQEWVRPAIIESLRRQSGAVVAPKGRERPMMETIHPTDDDDHERQIEDDPGRRWDEQVQHRDHELLMRRFGELQSIAQMMKIYKVSAIEIQRRLKQAQRAHVPSTPPD